MTLRVDPHRRDAGGAALDCVQVGTVRIEGDFTEIFRPVSECSVLVKVSGGYLRDTGFCVAPEPMKFDEIRTKISLGDEGLNGGQ